MSTISTHILDTARGRPAPGIAVTLETRGPGDAWTRVATSATDADGRVKNLVPVGKGVEPGVYRLRFETGPYLAAQGSPAFYPHVEVVFDVRDTSAHFHIPLLLSPFGYSTYRGS